MSDLVDAAISVSAALAAAISLLERGGRKAAASDKMFEQMLADYRKTLSGARTALAAHASATTDAAELVEGILIEFDADMQVLDGTGLRDRLAAEIAARDASAKHYSNMAIHWMAECMRARKEKETAARDERRRAAETYRAEVRRFLNLDYGQRLYSWHDVVDALESADAKIAAAIEGTS